ncbi:MAG: heat-inducible transcriptional repressor [Clostridia bacterium]|nr:heat-inducible transcription repressor HrcA [Clostridiales bacterium]MDK2984993.1 heat-inducible transcriptional repressor [Clostridia bacterium]
MPMDERKHRVLQAIIQDYITTAEPVGSRSIARKYDLGVSPATIRNEMADLEEMGYLEQPYTSAGRVPSDKGYRFYVDCIMEKDQLSEAEENFIKMQFAKKMEEIEEVIKKTSDLLSQLTQYTALVLGPNLSSSIFRYVQMSLIETGKALLVIVTQTGSVKHKIMDVPANFSQKDLNKVSMVLNSKLKGIAFEKVKKSVLDEIYNELIKEKILLETVLEILNNTLNNSNTENIFLGGTLNILNQPEFRDVEKIKSILGILEEKDILRKLMQYNDKMDGITVKIGEENPFEEVRNCSLITATYHMNGEVVGSIGILGPTRMKYSKTIALVEYITQVLSNTLSNGK